MLFTVPERMLLLDVLPATGSYDTLKIVRELREAFSFSEEEHGALDVKVSEDGTRVRWNREAEAESGPKDVPVGEKALELVRDSLRQQEERRELTEATVGLYERFVLAFEERRQETLGLSLVKKEDGAAG